MKNLILVLGMSWVAGLGAGSVAHAAIQQTRSEFENGVAIGATWGKKKVFHDAKNKLSYTVVLMDGEDPAAAPMWMMVIVESDEDPNNIGGTFRIPGNFSRLGTPTFDGTVLTLRGSTPDLNRNYPYPQIEHKFRVKFRMQEQDLSEL